MTRWQRSAGLLTAAFVAAVGLAGCRGAQQGTADAGAGGGGGGGTHYTIAVIPKGTSQSFWKAVKAGADAAAAEAGNVTIDWNGPAAETDVDGQIRIIQNAISRRVSAIVLAACNANSAVRYVEQAQQQNIPVITIDSGITPDISLAYLATDNVKGGQVAADALAELIGGKGKVGCIPFVKGAASSDQREQGFRDGLKRHPDVELVRVLYSDADVSIAMDRAKSMMASVPDLAGIFAANQASAEGAIQAVEQLGKAGKVKLVCFDASEAQIRALRAGTVQALIVQDPFRMGYEGVRTALRAVRGERIEPRIIDTGVTKVTMENIDTPEVQRLLNPEGVR
ncbi:MAG TPA: ABC transporter substrate-binding protein [Chthonomonadales bacterium]|nr:ABC transporter substrate-binding protein [Chthonomonadales bacterium]